MSLRPAPWPLFGTAGTRRAEEFEHTRRPQLRLVEGGNAPRLERLSARQRLVCLVALVGLILFAVVAFHVVLSQGQFRIEAMRDKIEAEQDEYSRMRLQVAQLESPARIKNEAQTRLGMVRPDRVRALAPAQGDLPAGVVTPPRAQSELGSDLASWSEIKPHLSPTTK